MNRALDAEIMKQLTALAAVMILRLSYDYDKTIEEVRSTLIDAIDQAIGEQVVAEDHTGK